MFLGSSFCFFFFSSALSVARVSLRIYIHVRGRAGGCSVILGDNSIWRYVPLRGRFLFFLRGVMVVGFFRGRRLLSASDIFFKIINLRGGADSAELSNICYFIRHTHSNY